MTVNSYLLFRGLIAVRKKEFFSLVDLVLRLLYLQPEGRSVNSLCWGWVVDALQRGQWSSDDLLCYLYHSLQAFQVQSRSASVLHGVTAGQDANSIIWQQNVVANTNKESITMQSVLTPNVSNCSLISGSRLLILTL